MQFNVPNMLLSILISFAVKRHLTDVSHHNHTQLSDQSSMLYATQLHHKLFVPCCCYLLPTITLYPAGNKECKKNAPIKGERRWHPFPPLKQTAVHYVLDGGECATLESKNPPQWLQNEILSLRC